MLILQRAKICIACLATAVSLRKRNLGQAAQGRTACVTKLQDDVSVRKVLAAATVQVSPVMKSNNFGPANSMFCFAVNCAQYNPGCKECMLDTCLKCSSPKYFSCPHKDNNKCVKFCPNNCNGHACDPDSGECRCDAGYGGEDCSGKASLWPLNLQLPSLTLVLLQLIARLSTQIVLDVRSSNALSVII